MYKEGGDGLQQDIQEEVEGDDEGDVLPHDIPVAHPPADKGPEEDEEAHRAEVHH